MSVSCVKNEPSNISPFEVKVPSKAYCLCEVVGLAGTFDWLIIRPPVLLSAPRLKGFVVNVRPTSIRTPELPDETVFSMPLRAGEKGEGFCLTSETLSCICS